MSEKKAAPLVRPVQAGEKLRGAEKMARIPIKIVPTEPAQYLRKPKWIRAEFTGTREVQRLKAILRENRDVLDQAAAELLAHETLDAGQIPRPKPVSGR